MSFYFQHIEINKYLYIMKGEMKLLNAGRFCKESVIKLHLYDV